MKENLIDGNYFLSYAWLIDKASTKWEKGSEDTIEDLIN